MQNQFWNFCILWLLTWATWDIGRVVLTNVRFESSPSLRPSPKALRRTTRPLTAPNFENRNRSWLPQGSWARSVRMCGLGSLPRRAPRAESARTRPRPAAANTRWPPVRTRAGCLGLGLLTRSRPAASGWVQTRTRGVLAVPGAFRGWLWAARILGTRALWTGGWRPAHSAHYAHRRKSRAFGGSGTPASVAVARGSKKLARVVAGSGVPS